MLGLRKLLRLLVVLAALVAPLMLASRTDAGTYIIVQSVTSAPGAAGSFTVDLEITGNTTVDLASFSIAIQADKGVQLTGGDSNVSSYVFGTNSLGFTYTQGPNATSATIADVYNPTATPLTLAAGTYGLGEFDFIAPTIQNTYDLTLESPQSSLTNPSFASIVPDSVTNGTLTVRRTIASTPEPSTAILSMIALALVAAIRSPFFAGIRRIW